MKQFLLFACLSIFTLGLSAQTVFVDADATGSGDGTTWADAFTNLNDAITASAAGSSLWIADGTYVIPAERTSFFIDKNLSLLGGFNGTETSADAADPATNVTVLSGDFMQNDVQGSYDSLSRADNASVIVVDTTSSPDITVNIDGLTIQDGNATGFDFDENTGSIRPFLGGGIRALATVNVSNVILRANHADFGAAIGVSNDLTDGSTFDNLTVVDNYTGARWVFYNRENDGVVLSNSSFSGANEGVVPSGMVLGLFTGDFTVENCTFSDVATTNRGAAISTQDCFNVVVRGCTVTDTEADLGGGFYLRNFDNYFDADGNEFPGSVLVEDCTLSGIASDRWGGAILISQLNSTIQNVTVSDVEGVRSVGAGLGGAVYLQSNSDPGVLPLTTNWQNLNISDVESGGVGGGIFIFNDPDYTTTLAGVSLDNVSTIGSGGGLYVSGGGASLAPENVMVLDNVSINNAVANARGDGSGGFGGGSIFFSQDINVTKSSFTNNEAALDGGNGAGIYGQGDGITMTISDSDFSGNRALSGSALAVFGVPINVTVTNSSFDENGRANNPGNAYRGGAIAFFHGEGSVMNIDGCEITENAVTQEAGIVSGGGGLYLGSLGATAGGTLTVTNTNFEANTAEDAADGGAVYFVDGVAATFDNTDFSFNSAENGGAMTSFLFQIPDTVNNIPMSSLPTFSVDVSNAIIRSNTAGVQGGAITTFNSIMSFTNTVFALNAVSSDGGSGGAIIFNGASPNVNANNEFSSAAPAELSGSIVHCSFFGNTNSGADGAVGNAIALFQQQNPFNDVVQSLNITMQNNVFFQEAEDQPAIEWEPATEDPTTAFGTINIVSNGGNIFNTENGPNVVLGTDDLVDDNLADAELLFEDPFENTSDFPLLRPNLTDPESDNPLIDAGTTGALVPATGIDGNPRGETPDVGAYELEWSLTGVQTVAESGLDMDFFPNPTVDVVNIRNNDQSIQTFSVMLTDNMGRILRSNRFSGTVNTLDLTNVPTGVYTLQLIVDGNVYSQQVVKQ